MITRSIGKLLRGSATPAQLMAASVLGGVLGFMPGFVQAAGLIVLLLLVLVVMNANLGLAGLVGLAGKLVSLLVMPISFAVGRFLLDGPTEGLFRWVINMPVLALFGFEYYATTGGVVMGVVFGVAMGYLVIGLVKRFRRRMSKVEAGSERYRKWAGKGWVKALAWLVIGGGHKGSYEDVIARKGKLIRPIGVVFALLVVVLLFVARLFFAEPIVTAAMQMGLERANGATVDVRSAELDLSEGRLSVVGLAMADANDLGRDLLRADRLEADISGLDLLRKRITLDRVELSGAEQGAERRVPGRLVGKRVEPSEPPETGEGEKTIEDYIEQAKVWKDRLAQVRDWLEKVGGEDGGEGEGTEAERDETLEERLKREIEARGYGRVAATHLIEGSPTVTVRELLAAGVKVSGGAAEVLGGETVDIEARNLSTQPYLLEEGPRITVKSSGDALDVAVDMASASAGGGDSSLRFVLRGLSGDLIGRQLAIGGESLISGGTVEVEIDGGLRMVPTAWIDLPMNITLHGTTLAVPGVGESRVERLALPLGLRGPLDAPAIMLSEERLADALVAAGADALAGRVRGEAEKALDKAAGELGEKLGDKVNERLGGDAANEVKDRAKGLLDGILGGDRK